MKRNHLTARPPPTPHGISTPGLDPEPLPEAHRYGVHIIVSYTLVSILMPGMCVRPLPLVAVF